MRVAGNVFKGLKLAGLLGLAGCADNAPPSLPPVPAQSLPVTVKVPVPVPLPFDMKQPCPDPAPFPLVTDADLINAADAWKVAKRCSDRKLQAIDEAEKKATGQVTP